MRYNRQVGTSREGHPVYLYTDPTTGTTRFVVVLPDGRAFYSDQYGRISPPGTNDKAVGGALLGGLVLGLAFGPAGAIIGAIAGAVVGNEASKGEKKGGT